MLYGQSFSKGLSAPRHAQDGRVMGDEYSTNERKRKLQPPRRTDLHGGRVVDGRVRDVAAMCGAVAKPLHRAVAAVCARGTRAEVRRKSLRQRLQLVY